MFHNIKKFIAKRNNALNAEHIIHLNNLVNGGLMRTYTPDDVAQDLVKRGLAKNVTGGLVATDIASKVLQDHGVGIKKWL